MQRVELDDFLADDNLDWCCLKSEGKVRKSLDIVTNIFDELRDMLLWWV